MNKKIYESPKINIVTFSNNVNTNLDTSSVQLGFKKTSYSKVNNVDSINF